jgi:hypothetical protein
MLSHYHLVSMFPLRGLLECTFYYHRWDGLSFDRSGPRLLRLKRLSHIHCLISHRYYYLHKNYSVSVWGPKESLTTTWGFSVPFERSPRVYLLFPPMGSLSIRTGHGSCGWNASHARVVLFHIGTTTYIKSIACRCGAPKRVKAFYSRIKHIIMSGHYFVLSFFWNYHYFNNLIFNLNKFFNTFT